MSLCSYARTTNKSLEQSLKLAKLLFGPPCGARTTVDGQRTTELPQFRVGRRRRVGSAHPTADTYRGCVSCALPGNIAVYTATRGGARRRTNDIGPGRRRRFSALSRRSSRVYAAVGRHVTRGRIHTAHRRSSLRAPTGCFVFGKRFLAFGSRGIGSFVTGRYDFPTGRMDYAGKRLSPGIFRRGEKVSPRHSPPSVVPAHRIG